jgi:hypothetical protein
LESQRVVIRFRTLLAAQLLGYETTERALGFGLERCYRAQAQLTSDRRRRTTHVDLADDVRRSSWS